ncbi:MAG: radical SAM family heme chaperone HemW [Gammaproteobacteria bacterium]|nr:radical SAM family heme chaperone HemW [Gammaproteobacteria bacterium]
MNPLAPPLALYLHFPWCVRKCPYCDFNSYAAGEDLPAEAYQAALARDLEQQAVGVAGREITSVFLGGGTPSLFSPEQIGSVLAHARGVLRFAADVEITLEANPGAIEHGAFAGYRSAGINRVSLGAQSFDPEALRRLGRIHAADDTRRAAEELHAAGLVNFNLDLMYALPGQGSAAAEADVVAALALAPAHVSHYQLTLEPGTLFGARPPAGLPDEDTALEMQQACEARLVAAGLERYEISAYARAGRRCRHNLNYWHFGDYLGIGAGAHGKLSEAASGRIVRTARAREPRRYLAEVAAGPPEVRAIPPSDQALEFMINALRLREGFARALFEARTAPGWPAVAATLERARADGLLLQAGETWRTTPRGERFLNDLLQRFLP